MAWTLCDAFDYILYYVVIDDRLFINMSSSFFFLSTCNHFYLQIAVLLNLFDFDLSMPPLTVRPQGTHVILRCKDHGHDEE